VRKAEKERQLAADLRDLEMDSRKDMEMSLRKSITKHAQGLAADGLLRRADPPHGVRPDRRRRT
jgi:hypothetical protein